MTALKAKLQFMTHVWLLFFFVLPLIYVFILAFLSKGVYGGIEWSFSLRAFERVLSLQYTEIFFRTLVMAAVTAFFCTVLGAICAWFINSKPKQIQDIWILLFVLPFLLNSLIRLYAIQGFVGVSGPVQGFISFFQADYHSTAWTHNQVIMYLGLILTYLPFTILPLSAAFEKWEPQFFEAAQDLGANLWQSFWQVIFPQIKINLLTAFAIVFVPCLGEYLVPEILGGSQKLYWGQLIAEAFLKWRDWPVGSAFGLILILSILLFFLGSQLKGRKA